jgi:hypothetical protein
MATLTRQKVRAQVEIGGLIVRTPDVVSFNVRRARGQMVGTFSASVKVDYNDTSGVIGSKIVIRAGLEGSLKTIFTGRVFRSTINPVRSDASKVMLNLSGKDVMADMEGQKINRRVTTYVDGTTSPDRWGVVNSVIKQSTPVMEKFKEIIVDKKPKAALELSKIPVIHTPDANRVTTDINRAVDDKNSSTITWETMPPEEAGGT